jgi:hypothetical protein
MKEVLNRAIELEDWVMVERVAYQLRMISGTELKSFAEFELSYGVYDFDWMYTA